MDEEKRGGITDRLPSLQTNWRFARNMSIRRRTVTQASSPSRGESLVSPDRKASRLEHLPVKMSHQQAMVPDFNVSRPIGSTRTTTRTSSGNFETP